MKATRALVLFLLTVLLCPALASAGTLGPALNYEELLDMVRRAKDGDILLVSGEMTATEEAISSPALLQISGDGKAVLHRLHISDSSVILSDVDGLYTANPHRDPTAQRIPVVSPADELGVDLIGNAVCLGCLLQDAEHRMGEVAGVDLVTGKRQRDRQGTASAPHVENALTFLDGRALDELVRIRRGAGLQREAPSPRVPVIRLVSRAAHMLVLSPCLAPIDGVNVHTLSSSQDAR